MKHDKNKSVQSREQVPFHSWQGHPRVHKTLTNEKAVSFFFFYWLKCSYSVFLNNNHGRESTKEIPFFFFPFFYTGLHWINVRLRRAYWRPLPPHTGETVQVSRVNSRGIVLACKTSLDSPSEGKNKIRWGFYGKSLKSAIRTKLLLENRWQQAGLSPLKKMH